jgi:Spy/CpxP family protein refolding chaperone
MPHHDDSNTPRNHAAEPAGTTPSPSRRRWFAGVAGLAAIGGAGVFGAAAAHAKGWGGMDPEERARRMEWRLGRLVQAVGGSQQQQDQVVAIARSAMADLKPLRDQARELRRQGLQVLSATVIDRAALERLRVARMQLDDARSRRMTQAFADGADVFTPEQRVKLADHMRSFGRGHR